MGLWEDRQEEGKTVASRPGLLYLKLGLEWGRELWKPKAGEAEMQQGQTGLMGPSCLLFMCSA